MSEPYAEELNYWLTSKSAPDTWLDKAEAIIVSYGGEVVSRGIGRQGDQEAVMFEIVFGEDRFRILWALLKSKHQGRDENSRYSSAAAEGAFRTAARRQAATMLYHDVKARGLRYKIFGARVAFFEFLLLPDGRCVGELAAPELLKRVPKMLTTGNAP